MVLLMGVEIVMTLSLLLVSSSAWLWLLFVLVFFRMAAASFYFTLEMSLLPRILNAAKLKRANEIHSMIWSLSYTLGMAVSGVVVYGFGVYVAFVLDALLFVMALLLLRPLRLPGPSHAHHGGVLKMMRESWHYIRTKPVIRHLMLLHAFVGIATYDALVPLMAEFYYAPAIAVALAIGWLHASRAVGLVIGPMLFGRWLNNRRLGYLFGFQALTIMAWALMLDDFFTSLLFSFFVGLATTTLWSYTYTLLQVHTEARFYGRIVAYNDMLFLLSVAVVSLCIGQLATAAVPLGGITALLGSGFVLAALYWRWIVRRFTPGEPSRDL